MMLSVCRVVIAGLLVVATACGGGDDESEGADAPSTTTTAEPEQPAEAGGGGQGESESADGTAESDAPTTTGTTRPAERNDGDVSWVAAARGAEVEVFPMPEAGEPSHRLGNPNENGAPLVFLVDGPAPSGDWVRVHLPVRPNGSTGWVRAADVTVAQHHYRLRVELDAHRLTLSEGGEVTLEAPVGVGTTDTPTPGGTYYVKELLEAPDPDGAYGPYAFGLSGFSNELTEFNGGTGVIGIHGTDEPDSVGTDVSHGCIRLTNDVVTQLAGVLPLGTPVEIVP